MGENTESKNHERYEKLEGVGAQEVSVVDYVSIKRGDGNKKGEKMKPIEEAQVEEKVQKTVDVVA